MEVKNISAKIITLRCKEGKDKILPLEEVEILKGNEVFAKNLIKIKELEEIKEVKLTKAQLEALAKEEAEKEALAKEEAEKEALAKEEAEKKALANKQ